MILLVAFFVTYDDRGENITHGHTHGPWSHLWYPNIKPFFDKRTFLELMSMLSIYNAMNELIHSQ